MSAVADLVIRYGANTAGFNRGTAVVRKFVTMVHRRKSSNRGN